MGTQKCAFKCCQIDIGEEHRDVYKEPITDPGKKSKKGLLFLHKVDGKLVTVARHEGNKRTVWVDGKAEEQGESAIPVEQDAAEDLLVTVFENGRLLVDSSFEEIRNRSTEAP